MGGKANILACVAAALLSACSPSSLEPRESGEALTFVSLNPCLDAILVEVAAPEQVLALSHYSRDPAASSMDVAVAERFGVTGGTAEEVIALQPDVVLASTFIAPATRAALERSGLRVEAFGSPGSVAESLDQIEGLAGLIGRPEGGERLVATIQNSAQAPQGEAISAMLWQPGQIVAGETSLVAEHMRWAGLANHGATRGLGQADFVSLEALLADPPELLLIAGDAAGQTHPMLDRLERTHVARFEPKLFFCAGPTIPRARERLLEIRGEMERGGA